MFSPSMSANRQLFELDSLNDILPFNDDNKLSSNVQSDHAEIALRVANDKIINIWNISNPAYHCYYKYGDNPPFHKTHLFVNKPFTDSVMESSLTSKIESQVATIAARFVLEDVNIQVIVEGYEAFYKLLSDTIKALGVEHFQIISLLNHEKPKNWKAENNVTALLIDTSQFKIIESGVIFSKYMEEEDGNKEKDFHLPFAHIRDISSDHTMIIAGVHVNGCGFQYPKTGLKTLALSIEALRNKTSGLADVIAAGDFNTPVMNSRKEMSAIVLNAPYPTHVNPKSQAGNYDQVVILPKNGSNTLQTMANYEMLFPSYLSISSQCLIKSIEKSRENYLAKL